MTPRDLAMRAELVRRLTLGPLAEAPAPGKEAKAEIAVPVAEKPKSAPVPAPVKK